MARTVSIARECLAAGVWFRERNRRSEPWSNASSKRSSAMVPLNIGKPTKPYSDDNQSAVTKVTNVTGGSTRGRFAGNSWAGCLPDLFVERCTGARPLLVSSITSLTTGSSSNNCICACESFSPPAPYFSIRISRSRSSSTRIRSSAYCSLLFSCAMSSRSAGDEGMGATLTMG